MKIITFKEDIQLLCKQANNFPDGVPETFKALETELLAVSERKCFGIYEEADQKIKYRAAFSVLDSDTIDNNTDTFIIEKGDYLSMLIPEFYKKIETIGPTFCKLFENESVDKTSASIEMYEGNNLVCMVKLKTTL